MMQSQAKLICTLKEYGFFCMEGAIPAIQAERFLMAQKILQRSDLVFQPLRELCCERPLSQHTSLYIEGYERFSSTRQSLGYFYDFYKATYLFGSQPARVKVYGTHLSQKKLLSIVKGFSFLIH